MNNHPENKCKEISNLINHYKERLEYLRTTTISTKIYRMNKEIIEKRIEEAKKSCMICNYHQEQTSAASDQFLVSEPSNENGENTENTK